MNTLELREQKALLTMTSGRGKSLWECFWVMLTLNDSAAHDSKTQDRNSLRQSAYVDWKYSEWRDWVRTPPKARARRNRLGTVSTNIGFSTLSHVELEKFRVRFYQDHRKVVPADLELTSLSMAVWFMDDGSRKSSSVAVCTSTLRASPLEKFIFCNR